MERHDYKSKEWIGQKFGKLTVIGTVNAKMKSGEKQWLWNVRCDCGTEKTVIPNDLITGHSVSCGCYRKHKPCPTKTHGESHTKLHNIWCSMKRRCSPGAGRANRTYYGRGIRVCEQWNDYNVFAEWARSHGYNDNLSIERIDVNGDYKPDNCKWIPLAEQARNRRTTFWVELMGKRMSLAEACEICHMPYKQVFERIKKHGWSIEDALYIPIGGVKRRSGNHTFKTIQSV